MAESVVHYTSETNLKETNKNIKCTQKEEITIIINDPLKRGHFPVSIASSNIRQFSGTIGLLYRDYSNEKQLTWTSLLIFALQK